MQLAATSGQLGLEDQDLGILPSGGTPSQCDVVHPDGFTNPQQVFLGLHSDGVLPTDDGDTAGCRGSPSVEFRKEPGLFLGRWVRKPPSQWFIDGLLLLEATWGRWQHRPRSCGTQICFFSQIRSSCSLVGCK